MESVYVSLYKFILNTAFQILSALAEFCRIYDTNIWACFFPGTRAYCDVMRYLTGPLPVPAGQLAVYQPQPQPFLQSVVGDVVNFIT